MAIGSNAEAAGWPSVAANSYVLNDLSSQLPAEPLLLLSDGLPARGYLPYRKFLAGPGRHVIQAKDGRTWNFSVAQPGGSGGAWPPPPPRRGQGR
jgi:hypothetical protein